MSFIGSIISGLAGVAGGAAAAGLAGANPVSGAVLAGINALGSFGAQQQAQSNNLAALQAQYQYQSMLQQQQNDWNEKMWNKNNEYNTPAMQRSRLEAAGYNANMALGGLSGNVSQSPATSGSGGSVGLPNAAAAAMAALSGQKLNAETNLLNAQADAARAQAERDRQNANLSFIDSATRDAINNANLSNVRSQQAYFDSLSDYYFSQRHINWERNNADLRNLKAEYDKIIAETDNIKTLTPLQRNVLVAQAYMLRAQGVSNLSLAALNDINAAIQRSYEKYGIVPSTISELKARTNLTSSQVEYLRKDIGAYNFTNYVIPIWQSVNGTIGAISGMMHNMPGPAPVRVGGFR